MNKKTKMSVKTFEEEKQALLNEIQNEESGQLLTHANIKFRSDKDLVLEALKFGEFSLKYTPTEIKNNQEIMLKAVEYSIMNFVHAPESLKKNKEFMMKVVSINKTALDFLHGIPEIQQDIEIIWKSKKYFLFFDKVPTTNLTFNFKSNKF
jgi:hypothetical protein